MRFAGAAANSASNAALLKYRQLVDLGVTSGTWYFCTGQQFFLPGQLNMHSANTYTPVGGLGGLETIEDESDIESRTVRMWVSANNSATLFEGMREDMFNRPVTIRHVYLDPISNAMVSTPEPIWSGYVNKIQVHFADPEKGNYFELECETALRRKAELVNFTKECLATVMSQSGDTFFDYLYQVPMVKALWGNQATTFNGVSPGHWSVIHPNNGRNRSRYWTPGG